MVNSATRPSVSPRPPRRSGGFSQGLIRLLFFFATLIPTCIIAWRIDLINPRKEQPVAIQQPQSAPEPQVSAASPPVVPHSPPTPQLPAPLHSYQPQQSQAPSPLEPAARTEPVPREEPGSSAVTTPRPVETKAAKVAIAKKQKASTESARKTPPPPSENVAVDFKAKKQREPISLSGKLRVAGAIGCKHSIKPPEGLLGESVEVKLLDGPRPIFLAVSVQDRDGARFVFIEPTVPTDSEDRIPFTARALNDIRLRQIKTRNAAAKRVNAMRAELAQHQALLDSPLGKPVPVFRRAQARIPELIELIPAEQNAVAALDAEVKATEELIEFGQKLQGKCLLVIETIPQ